MFRKTVLALGVSVLFSSSAFAAHWGYSGEEGPDHWASLSSDYAMCGQGMNQSPIDLQAMTDAELPSIAFDYRSGMQGIVNNGHTVQVNMADGSSITVDGHEYELKQFHFHAPSENRIDGQAFPLEGHYVHADADGHLAVVAVMFEEGASESPLSGLWQHLPSHSGEQEALDSAEMGNPVAILPEDKAYYRFNGSLTTPPCSEGVAWMVLKTPVTISAEQVAAFRQVMGDHDNNRPVQPLNARLVIE